MTGLEQRGTEHRTTQRVTLLCPEGHHLGRLDTSPAFADVDLRPETLDGQELVWIDGHLLAWRCPKCVASGLRGATQVRMLRLEHVVLVPAVMVEHGPAHTRLRLSRAAIDRLVARLTRDGRAPSVDDHAAAYLEAAMHA
ncbi:hypothetical protein GCM10027418_19260 [Mariniluteicoccus endophyticus]